MSRTPDFSRYLLNCSRFDSEACKQDKYLCFTPIQNVWKIIIHWQTLYNFKTWILVCYQKTKHDRAETNVFKTSGPLLQCQLVYILPTLKYYIICKYSNHCETTLVSLETLTLGLAMNSTLLYSLVNKLCEEILWRTLCVVSCSLLDPQIEL